MAFFHLLDQLKQTNRPIRLASEIAGKPLTSYRPLLNDPEAREAGSSDPTPAELLERLAEIHAGKVCCQHGEAQRRREEAGKPVELVEVNRKQHRRGVLHSEAGAD